MKLGELLKRGILNGDWDDICKVYQVLTGQKISPPIIQNPLSNLLELDVNESEDEENENDEEEEIEEPIPKSKKKVISVVQDEDEQDENSEEEFKIAHTNPIENDELTEDGKVICRKIPFKTPLKKKCVGISKKAFIDDGKLHADEKGIGVPKISKRKRKSPLTMVVCTGCNKTYEVNKVLTRQSREDGKVINTYKCNKCCTGAR